VADILQRVEAHARVYFRHVRCFHRKEELLAEMTALCWKWFLRLVRRVKDVLQFISALVTYAARAVGSGRRVCGHEKARDVLSPCAQHRHSFTVGKLPDYSTLTANPLADALTDNTQTPPDEQVCFRMDFPAWLSSLGQRNRALATDMALGHCTLELAHGYGISPARVSQLRRDFHTDWTRFCGKAVLLANSLLGRGPGLHAGGPGARPARHPSTATGTASPVAVSLVLIPSVHQPTSTHP
jgi:hypothetical protein